jgi:hypothetical protein
MNKLSLRAYFLFCSLLGWVRLLAQNEDEDEFMGSRSRSMDSLIDPMEDMIDYQPFRITFSDIFWVVVLVVACYVFGKIWRGCTYLLLVFAALMYYLTH